MQAVFRIQGRWSAFALERASHLLLNSTTHRELESALIPCIFHRTAWGTAARVLREFFRCRWGRRRASGSHAGCGALAECGERTGAPRAPAAPPSTCGPPPPVPPCPAWSYHHSILGYVHTMRLTMLFERAFSFLSDTLKK